MGAACAKERVFISYSHADSPFVRFLVDDIRKLEIAVWIDEVELDIGDSLIARIGTAIAQSTYVLACISKASASSPWVRTELAIAATRGIREDRVFVLPILVGGSGEADIPPFLSHLVCIDFRCAADYDKSLHLLARRISPESLRTANQLFSTTLYHRVLAIDDARADKFVAAARTCFLRDWVIAHLAQGCQRPDPTERHWSYLALGRIGGQDTLQIIVNGQQDGNAFARLGAQRALQLHNANASLHEREKCSKS
jgi:hypothetical protein